MTEYIKTILNAIIVWVESKFDILSKQIPNDDDILNSLIDADLLPSVHDADGRILTDENGNVILRY